MALNDDMAAYSSLKKPSDVAALLKREGSLKDRIISYSADKISLAAKERELLESIKEKVNSEIPILNSKLPKDYEIGGFHVVPISDLTLTPIAYLTGTLRNGKPVNTKELPKLDQILMNEFHRIREAYGFRIEFLHYEGIV